MNDMQKFDPSIFGELDTQVDDADPGFNPIPVNVKINHQSTQFDIPGIANVDQLEVVVLSAMRVRTLFGNMGVEAETIKISEFTSKRPLCSSSDYVNGNLIDGDWDNAPESAQILRAKISEGALICAEGHCPMNEWGSTALMGKDGKGKACAELRRLCIWKPGWSIPVIISIPTSSIKAWDEYCSSLAIGDLKPRYVTTRMSLESRTAPGRNYSVVKFKFDSVIDEGMLKELLTPVNLRGDEQTLIKALVDIFRNRELTIEDYPATDEGDSGTVADDNLSEDF